MPKPKRTIVLKYGGNATRNRALRNKLVKDIILLTRRYYITIVHGGGPQISALMKRSRIKPKFVGGLRYTDSRTLKIAEKALSEVNSSIVNEINRLGGCALGISCRDGDTIIARRIKKLGFVGEVSKVNTRLIRLLGKEGIVPVVSSISSDGGSTELNVNADTAAKEIAIALNADELIFLTDVPGILNRNKNVIRRIKPFRVKSLIKRKIISGGMLPKIKGCIDALRKGVVKINITDAKKGLKITTGTVISK